ncbi:C69 family dipeptidase [Aquirufa aurantiipilula]|uniref:Carcinine hydrolase/isopenicillin-N N-acyltransferase family protein n=1 Tax=Aquirufa aurantiipilula TaxID=2696561 RepID=A0ABT6BJX8_9BACT|nr:C69 family dipeptidase [Aquirufa aurantiipilula]MDF5690633.1 carcinine hydrolase/isopenicillin-N N-acyltransferase family protein [Aquirufa aurantiipilula]
MCDTFFSPSHRNVHGNAILAKNSDREPNEAQQIVRFPAHSRFQKRVQSTFIVVDCPEQVHEVILSKPFQMWGAEMGVNEHGVAIGNEAVFTKLRLARKNNGLTGMDLLRLALEQSKTAKSALEKIIELLGKYGQDACGGYQDKGMFYSNSFLIADSHTAFVLETAGPFWAYKHLNSFYAISNLLTIGTDFDEIHPEAKAFAYQKSWMKEDVPFDFQMAFSEPFMTYMGRGASRKQQCELQAPSSNSIQFSVRDAFQILRSHKIQEDFEPCQGDMGNICLHAQGLLTPSQTTGSMVAELRENAQSTVWLTGSSAPCLSVFKPFYFRTNALNANVFPQSSDRLDHSYWWQWEKIHRRALADYSTIKSSIQRFQQEKEQEWVEEDQELSRQTDASKKEVFSQKAIEDCFDYLHQWEQKNGSVQIKIWPVAYRLYWMWQNRKMKNEGN